MTTLEPDDPAAIERDDALLDAAASGAPVDDPAATLLTDIATRVHAAGQGDVAGPGEAEGPGGGGARIRPIWRLTLGVSLVIALGGGLGVSAYGQLAPHAAGTGQSGFVVAAAGPSPVSLGTMTFTAVPDPEQTDTLPGGGAGQASGPSGLSKLTGDAPWRTAGEARGAAAESRQRWSVRNSGAGSAAPLVVTGPGEGPGGHSMQLPTCAAPTRRARSYAAVTHNTGARSTATRSTATRSTESRSIAPRGTAAHSTAAHSAALHIRSRRSTSTPTSPAVRRELGPATNARRSPHGGTGQDGRRSATSSRHGGTAPGAGAGHSPQG